MSRFCAGFPMDVVAEGGYKGIEARNADEAIRILETRTDIRIVFTDIEMSGSMDGAKLAHAVRGRWAPIEIIIASGWTKLAVEDIPSRARYFRKPYKPAEIIDALHQLAAWRPSGRRPSRAICARPPAKALVRPRGLFWLLGVPIPIIILLAGPVP